MSWILRSEERAKGNPRRFRMTTRQMSGHLQTPAETANGVWHGRCVCRHRRTPNPGRSGQAAGKVRLTERQQSCDTRQLKALRQHKALDTCPLFPPPLPPVIARLRLSVSPTFPGPSLLCPAPTPPGPCLTQLHLPRLTQHMADLKYLSLVSCHPPIQPWPWPPTLSSPTSLTPAPQFMLNAHRQTAGEEMVWAE